MDYKMINADELRSNFEGDEEILLDLINEFSLKYVELLSQLEKAINENNFNKIQLSAHTLKGVVSNFYAEEIRLLFYEIENQANQKNEISYQEKFKTAVSLMDFLVKELQQLKNELN